LPIEALMALLNLLAPLASIKHYQHAQDATEREKHTLIMTKVDLFVKNALKAIEYVCLVKTHFLPEEDASANSAALRMAL